MNDDSLIAEDPEERPVAKSHLSFPVVGIGASAGGVAALQALFGDMPTHSGMAFVVVIHLSPVHESAMAHILQQATAMPVVEVVKTTAIEADHVYVISPSKDLSMTDGCLVISELSRPEGRHTAIDLFFRSLAQAHRERSVCVVLSGTGADGSQGLKRLKELGGVTFAQSPDDAQYDGMPRSAVATGLVDIVLPAAEMPQKLVELWENARRLTLPSPPDDLHVISAQADDLHQAEEALLSIKALLRERTGHDFAHYKRATVLRRLERRMQVNALSTLPAYRQVLESNPKETAALLQDMLISVTNFFRDRDAFETLERELMERPRARASGEPFRAWVAGCATGEEAFSIAMMLRDLGGSPTAPAPVQVFASDIDQRAIEVARSGFYPESIATDVPPMRLRLHFGKEPDGYRIVKSVRDSVLFSVHNVLRDPPFTRVDLICCRNLLIYLDREAQAQLLQTFHFALQPGGLLFLGNSESVDAVRGLFQVVDKKHRIYRVSPVARTSRFFTAQRPHAVAQQQPAAPAPVVPRPPLEDLHERVLSEFAAPTVLIDADHSILHVNERATHLLRIAGGAPTNKLLDLVRPEIRVELRTALFRAVETTRSVRAHPAEITINGEIRHLDISVRPVHDGGSGNGGAMFLITFDETDLSLASPAEEAGEKAPLLLALEAELLHLKEQLRTSAGESATSTEELRASNEELQTINEELRSATEELETSREELQSVNEELITVNHELHTKIDETGKVNDDLHNLIASTDIGTVFVDRGLRIKRYTPQATTLFNLIATDVGRSLLDITHRLDYEGLAADVAEIFRTLKVIEREVSSTDGRWFLVRVLPYRTSEDRIDGAILNLIDVTARRRAEEQLHRSEQRLRMVVESMRDYAIITFDDGGLITSWNAGAERIFGYTEAEATGQPSSLIFTVEDRQNGEDRNEMRKAREKGRAEDDRWHLRKDGRVLFCSGIMTPLVDGELVGYAKIARDLTHHKVVDAHRDAVLSAEKAVRSRLEEASVLKDEFLAIMSHELKNPLNLIQLNAELLLRLPQVREVPVVSRAAATIRSAVASQAQIIDDLLDLSRLNTGKFVLSASHVEFNPVVERIVSAVQADATARQQSIRLSLKDGVAVFADPVRIEQIVWNLVTNAFKFTPTGGTVSIALQVDDGMARFDVSDTGIGLEPAFIDQVFEMFRQVETGANRTRGGLGIGLALVKRLAELHGGRVRAASEGLGKGSTFSVWLPLDSGDNVAPLHGTPSSVLNGLRVLLVDDEIDTLAAFGELLGLEGAQANIVGNASEAFGRAMNESFDVIVSDIAMPGHDGYWLIGKLRQEHRTSDVLTIAVSGMARPGDKLRALEAGFDSHLGKPLQLAALKDEIERLRAKKAGA